MSHKKQPALVGATVDAQFEHDFIFLRSCHKDGRSRSCMANGFLWPIEVGAVVEAPDWDPNPERACGGGLHGLPSGIGDWGLLAVPTEEALWYVCGARLDEAVFSTDKVRVRRCRVLYVGALPGALKLIAPAMTERVLALVEERTKAAIPEGEISTGNRGAASGTGYGGAASSTGYRGAASSTGYGGAASSTGNRGAASSTGEHGVALAAGIRSRAMVANGSLLVLVERNEEGRIIGHISALPGEHGIEAGKWYELRGGKPVEVAP